MSSGTGKPRIPRSIREAERDRAESGFRRYTTVNVNWQTAEEQRREPEPEKAFAISEVQARTGLTPRTIRYYEELGLLPGVRRRVGGRRVYGHDELQRLGFITRLKTLGLSLGEIKELDAVYSIAGSTQDMLGHLDALLAGHQSDLRRRVEALQGLQAEIGSYRAHVSRRLQRGAGEGRE